MPAPLVSRLACASRRSSVVDQGQRVNYAGRMTAKRLGAHHEAKSAQQAHALLLDAVVARDQAARRVDELAVEARMCGVTWEVIGLALGLTKQGAHQRYTGDGAA